MTVQRFMQLIETDDGLHILFRWKRLENTEDFHEPLRQVYLDIPEIFYRLLKHKSTPANLVEKARSVLSS